MGEQQSLIKHTQNLLGVASILIVSFAVVRFGGVGVVNQSILQITVAVLLAFWVFLIWCDRRSLPNGVEGVLLLLAFGYGFARGEFAKVRYLAQSDVAYFGMLVGVLLVVASCAKERKWRRRFILFLIVLATGEALYALVQFVTKSGTILGTVQPAVYAGRASGTYINPNHGAWLISMGVVGGAPLMLNLRGSWATRIFCGYAVVVCFAALIVTFSRGALLAVCLVLIVFFAWWLWHRKINWAIIAICAVLAGPLAYLGSKGLFSSGFGKRHNITDVRFLALWPAAIKVWEEEPILGVGPGYFSDCYRRYRPALYVAQTDPVRVHNDYLNILADWGLCGLLAAVALIGVVGVSAIRALSCTDDEGTSSHRQKWGFETAAIMTLLYALFHAATDFNLYLPANGMILATLFGLNLTNNFGSSGTCFRGSRFTFWRFVWSVVALSLASFLVLHGLKRFKEHRQLSASLENSREFQSVRDHLLTAHQICQDNSDTMYQLGEAYRRFGAEGPIEDTDAVRESLRWLDMAAKINPREPFYWIARGKALHWLDRDDEALASFKHALIADPNNYRVESMYAWCMFEMNRYTEAFYWFKRSQKLNYEENTVAKFYMQQLSKILQPQHNWPPRGGDIMPRIEGLNLDELSR